MASISTDQVSSRPQGASGIGEVITQLVHLSLTEPTGRSSGLAQRESAAQPAVR